MSTHNKKSRTYRKVMFSLGTGLLAANSAFAISGDNFDFNGYLRSGVRSTFPGAYQDCVTQGALGSQGNNFRLGNECSDYNEISFSAHFLKGKATEPFFDTVLTFGFNPPGNTQSESETPNVRQAYFQAGNFGGNTLKYWVGKRFYRDTNIHMNDIFYFENISGNGAGIYDIQLPNGTLAFAYLIESNGTSTTLSDGKHPELHFYDLRAKDINIFENSSIDLWAGYGQTTHNYATGSIFGIKHNYKFGASGLNELSVQRGFGVMHDLALGGYNAPAPNTSVTPALNDQKGLNRTRIVDHLTMQPMKELGYEFAAMYEAYNTAGESFTSWNVGTRPVYNFTEHLSLASEVGASRIKPASTGADMLYRLTIAPQISFEMGHLARPVMRTFVTTNLGKNGTGAVYGFQGEVWF